MKIDLGFIYLYLGRDGFYIEIDKHPWLWVVLNFSNKRAFDRIEASITEPNERLENLPT